MMADSLKGKFPWRLGATSYVVPADLITNVLVLADQVDDIQLLFFESAANSRLAHPVDVVGLQEIAADHALTYTVHLPGDIRLGHEEIRIRRQGIDEIVRLMSELNALAPLCYDLHLHPEELPEARWIDNLRWSLAELANRVGDAGERIALENTEIPPGLIMPFVEEYGFSFCFDVGHILRYGHDLQEAFRLLPRAGHIHYHAVRGERDHQSLSLDDTSLTRNLFGEFLKIGYTQVLTLEVYAMKKLKHSMAVLETVWEQLNKEQ